MTCHRRAGKTELALAELAHAALARPGSTVAYIAPLKLQGRQIVWQRATRLLAPVTAGVHESEGRITLTNGSRFLIAGAGDDGDALRGLGLVAVALDEFAQMTDATWHAAIRPTLSDTNGEALFTSTPSGKDALYRLVQATRSGRTSRSPRARRACSRWRSSSRRGGRSRPGRSLASTNATRARRCRGRSSETRWHSPASRAASTSVDVEEGIDAANRLLGRCHFDEKYAALGIDRLRGYRRNSETERPIHDESSHGADAFRYLALGLRDSGPVQRFAGGAVVPVRPAIGMRRPR